MAQSTLKRILVGRELATHEADHQRLSRPIGLAVFSSDAISSTAYATGEILLVLVGAGGMGQTHLLTPIAILVVVLLAIVVNSYRETIHAYPDGGGAYVVARENLGEIPSLVAGASLLTDYVLTVSVSVAAGVLAMYSAFPDLRPYRVWLCLGFVVMLTIGNLRGVKESGRVFAVPTYLYIAALAIFIGYALFRKIGGDLPLLYTNDASLTAGQREHLKEVYKDFGPYTGTIGLYIFARAFSSGAVALSGVEAISNGIPAFRKPTSKNAAVTLGWMALILGTGFFALNFIASWMRPIPSEGESALSTMGRALFGSHNPAYFFLQFTTMAILVLAANTAYADFPRLAAILGRDSFLPRQFGNRGDRLVFSNGVLILAGAAALLLVLFNGDVSLLIPLYAVGVFTSFTISQTGMVRHHLKERAKGWRLSVFNSALGAVATFIVAIVVVVSKFKIGAWVVVLIIPIIVVGFRSVKRHYDHVARQLRLEPTDVATVHGEPLSSGVVVLVGGVNRSSLQAIRYARSLAGSQIQGAEAVALSVAINEDDEERIRGHWDRYGIDLPLEVRASHFRDLTETVEDYLAELETRWGHPFITVVIPEFILPHWWEGMFHNQSAARLRIRLLNRPNTVVVNVPYHLSDDDETGAIPATDATAETNGPTA